MPNFVINEIDGDFTQIAVGNAEQIWCVNANDKIYRRTGSGWTLMPGAAVNVSVAADGTAWVVNRAGNAYRWTGTDWIQVSASLTQVSVGSANLVWGVNANDQIFRWLGGDSWEQITGSAVNVSVAADGAVWAVNRAGNIYQWSGSGWRQVSGSLKQVSVASANAVWGVSANDKICRWLGGDSWEQITGSLKWVSVGNDGTVMGAKSDLPAAPAPQSSPAPTPQLLFLPTGDYTIMSIHNRYLCREEQHYVANRTSAGRWERFTVTRKGTDPSSGYLITDFKGHYLDVKATWFPYANNIYGIQPRDKPSKNEPGNSSTFFIDPLGGNVHSLKVNWGTWSLDLWLSAEPSGAVGMQQHSRAWEHFTIVLA
jgi:hypothetical protein